MPSTKQLGTVYHLNSRERLTFADWQLSMRRRNQRQIAVFANHYIMHTARNMLCSESFGDSRCCTVLAGVDSDGRTALGRERGHSRLELSAFGADHLSQHRTVSSILRRNSFRERTASLQNATAKL